MDLKCSLLHFFPNVVIMSTTLMVIWMCHPWRTKYCHRYTLIHRGILSILIILGQDHYSVLFVSLLLQYSKSSFLSPLLSSWLLWFIWSYLVGGGLRFLSVHFLLGVKFIHVGDVCLSYGRLYSWYAWYFLPLWYLLV